MFMSNSRQRSSVKQERINEGLLSHSPIHVHMQNSVKRAVGTRSFEALLSKRVQNAADAMLKGLLSQSYTRTLIRTR